MEISSRDKCYFCKKEAEGFVMFNNRIGLQWLLMPENESAHADCYLMESIRFYMEKAKGE